MTTGLDLEGTAATVPSALRARSEPGLSPAGQAELMVGPRRYAVLVVDDDLDALAAVREPLLARLQSHPGVVDARWRPCLSKAAEDLLLGGQFALEAAVTLEPALALEVFCEARVDLGYAADRPTIESLYVQEAAWRAASEAEVAVQTVMGWPLGDEPGQDV